MKLIFCVPQRRPLRALSAVILVRWSAFLAFTLAIFQGLLLEARDPAIAAARPAFNRGAVPLRRPGPDERGRLVAIHGRLPMSFEKNAGQLPPEVLFASHGPGYSVLVTQKGPILNLNASPPGWRNEIKPGTRQLLLHNGLRQAEIERFTSIRFNFQGSSETGVQALDPLPGKMNYFVGDDARQWRTDIPSHARVRYSRIYPGISVTLSGTQQQLAFDFKVEAGSDPSKIKIALAGAEKISIEPDGALLISAGDREIRQEEIAFYQTAGGVRRKVPGRYFLDGDGNVGLQLGPYDPGESLQANSALSLNQTGPTSPGFVYSTLLGGLGDDTANGVAIDAAGNAYIVGETNSTDFRGIPIPGVIRSGSDAFVTKFNTTGSGTIFSTIIGGEARESGKAIALDPTGGIYIAGETTSGDFPKLTPFQSTIASGGGVSKTTDGASRWADAKNGLTDSLVLSVVVDPSNPATLYASTFPTGVFKSSNGGSSWSLSLPRSSLNPAVLALAVDPGNSLNVYAASISGRVFRSGDGGVSWQPGIVDSAGGFIYTLVIDPTNVSTLYTGIYGRGIYKSQDSGLTWTRMNTGLTNLFVDSIVVDPKNPSLVYAGTDGGGVFKSGNGGGIWNPVNVGLNARNVISLAVDPKTPSILYAGTVFGVYKSTDAGETWRFSGLSLDVIFSFAINPSTPTTIYAGTGSGVYKSTNGGTTWVPSNTGLTFIFIQVLAIDPINPNTLYATALSSTDDAFVAKLSPSGNALVYSSYLGGTRREFPTALAVDSTGSAYYTGYTDSLDFPTVSGLQGTNAGGLDAFVTKIGSNGSIVFSTLLGGSGDDLSLDVALSGTRDIYLTGSTSSLNFPTANPLRSINAGGTDAFITRINSSGSPLVYSTFLGGSGADSGLGIALDSTGNAYVTGATNSGNFPTLGAVQPARGGDVDAFVSKLNPAGSSLIYSTYLGGSRLDRGQGISLDSSGNAYITGLTFSIDFPTANAPQPAKFGGVFKSSVTAGGFNQTSNGLTNPHVHALALDPSNTSTLYAGSEGGGIFKTTNGGSGWTAINNGLTDDTIYALAVNPSAPATAFAGTLRAGIFKTTNGGAGWTSVSNGVTRASIYALAIDPSTPATIYAGSFNSLVFKSTDGGSSFTALTVGKGDTSIYALAVDPRNSNTIYAGTLDSGIFKSGNGGGVWTAVNSGLGTPLVTSIVIDPNSSSTLYAGTFNGVFKSTDSGNTWSQMNTGLGFVSTDGFTFTLTDSLVIDRSSPSTLYAGTFAGVFKTTTGGTSWSPLGLAGAFNYSPALALDSNAIYASSYGDGEAFVAKVNAAGAGLIYSTYFGGNGFDSGKRIMVDTAGNAYVAGESASGTINLIGAAQSAFGGGLSDALLFKLSRFDAPVCSLTCSATVPAGQKVGNGVPFAAAVTASNCAGPETYSWNFGDGTAASTQQNVNHTYVNPGTYNWTLTVTAGTFSCSKTGTVNIAAPARRRP